MEKICLVVPLHLYATSGCCYPDVVKRLRERALESRCSGRVENQANPEQEATTCRTEEPNCYRMDW